MSLDAAAEVRGSVIGEVPGGYALLLEADVYAGLGQISNLTKCFGKLPIGWSSIIVLEVGVMNSTCPYLKHFECARRSGLSPYLAP